MARTGANKGFSLIEVLIAMSILTVGIMGVISMQTTAIKVQSRNKLSATVQLVGQSIIERVNANAIDDSSIISYSGLKTSDAAPTVEPAKSDHTYFSQLVAGVPGGAAEITVTNTRPFPVRVRVLWRDGAIAHHLDYDTYILPH